MVFAVLVGHLILVFCGDVKFSQHGTIPTRQIKPNPKFGRTRQGAPMAIGHVRKQDFEITGDPKGPPSKSTFWSGYEAPDS